MRLPPLTALRAFESAGRRLSFTAAAGELGVTPGAVSRQIRSLEDHLGVQLFVRANREVSLTAVGAEYLGELSEAFSLIGSATEAITAVPSDAPLRVATSSTFALRWLMPRLMSYYSRHPDENLQLSINLNLTDSRRDSFDAAIILGHDDMPHAVVRKLFRADLVPVCSPRLLRSGPPLERLADLERHTRLESTLRAELWPLWLDYAGAPDIAPANRLQFESSSLAYQAAIEGVGIAMANLPLVIDDLKSGRLVVPIPVIAPDRLNYNLLWPDRARRNPRLMSFRSWILEQARAATRDVEEVAAQIAQHRESWTP